MNYPTLEQYNEAFQGHQRALVDTELRQGTVSTTGLGLPLALCGGFALTYTINLRSSKYAVRCFHKESKELERRYREISSRIKSLSSPYFVAFEFQQNGINIPGKGTYPIVKMAWATGVTLGEFLEQNHARPSVLNNLRASLRDLAKYLETHNIAHGDIQPGNVMVSDSGKRIQLIDYDGMFVDGLKGVGSSELGHRNFQHPKRASGSWDASLDRFSFICLDLSIRALINNSTLWAKTCSDGDSILFKANDFATPAQSKVFTILSKDPALHEHLTTFASICCSPYAATPTLEDFLAGWSAGGPAFAFNQSESFAPTGYISAHQVLDATDYARCLKFVGDKVELIGRVLEIKEDKSRFGRPYMFINFGKWRGQIVKISIWHEGLDKLGEKPNETWIGSWISVTGLMEPPYVSSKYKYSHLSVSVTQSGQLHRITSAEAEFRLKGEFIVPVSENPAEKNRMVIEQMGKKKSGATPPSASTTKTAATTNQAILVGMKSIRSAQSHSVNNGTSMPRPIRVSTQPTPIKQAAVIQSAGNNTNGSSGNAGGFTVPSKTSTSTGYCFIATAVYGYDASETNILRRWRDCHLLPHCWGRIVVYVYYHVSPPLAWLVNRSSLLRCIAKSLLDRIIALLK